jgi:hypothetical protein
MPARWPSTRRVAALAAERAPADVTTAPPETSLLRHAALWTVAPGNPDDEWLLRDRRHRLARAGGPTALKRPAIRAGQLDAVTTPSPVTAAAPAAGRGPVTGDFSAVPAHRPADPRAPHGPYTRPLVRALEVGGRASVPLPGEICVPAGGLPGSPRPIGQPARRTTVRSGRDL